MAHRRIRLHIKQHCKQQELHPHHEHEKRQHPVHEEHRIPHHELLPERDQPPDHPDRREHRAGGVEERQGVETHLDVLRLEAEEEVAEVDGTEEAQPDLATDDVDTLMDAIIALDDLYREGQIPEEAYRLRRAELKARLAELI